MKPFSNKIIALWDETPCSVKQSRIPETGGIAFFHSVRRIFIIFNYKIIEARLVDINIKKENFGRETKIIQHPTP
jgi:hypothetical protein